jgi:hypothetical protein
MSLDVAEVLKKHAKMPFERLRVVLQLDQLHVSTIRRGIIFIFAVWSGPAFVAFHRLTGVLADIDTTGLDLVVVDIDCLTAEVGRELCGRNPGGMGETLWVRDGVVVARSALYTPDSEPEMIQHTHDLMDRSTT